MDPDINPFHELYVTEVVSPKEYTSLFSPFLVEHTLSLFLKGNLIIKGSQGSGKSMLLSLLKPEIRLAYFEARSPFPVPQRSAPFLSAGINITRSGAINFGQRPIATDMQTEMMLFPLYFADFVNYWIVRDILRSVAFMGEHAAAFDNVVSTRRLDVFATRLASEECWFGYLEGVSSFDALVQRLDARISLYRQFHQFSLKKMPGRIDKTRTGIGEPISRTARTLISSGVLRERVPILLRFDELHVLYTADELRFGLGDRYKQIINKALSTRDPCISYKIGTRSYAWENNLTIFGTTASLEKDRDYRVVDLDDLLRRKENRKTWIFPDFARDVFTRRLECAGFDLRGVSKPLRNVMGAGLGPDEASERYAAKSKVERALGVKDNWPSEWKTFLKTLYEHNKLSAILAVAWAHQQNSAGRINMHVGPPPKSTYPWNRLYWKKERISQSLLQLSANCAQRMMWAGEADILALSGGNILVFVSLCQHVWDAFLQSERGKIDRDKTDVLRTSIDVAIQAVGIQAASAYWYEKIPEGAGGHDRQRFIDRIAGVLREQMTKDTAMSYPGHNGFSLLKGDLAKNALVRDFLLGAVEYGDLQSIRHTTKSKDRKARVKWYLNPILSPYFRIPESHVKEPIYTTVAQVRQWMRMAEITEAGPCSQQMSLFSDGDAEVRPGARHGRV
jgi:hypothetical protein